MNFSNFLKSTESFEFSEFSKFSKFFEFSEIFEFFEFSKFMNMKTESKFFIISVIIDIADLSIDQSINQTPKLSINQLIEITSAKFTYTSKSFIKQNPIKKRKSNDMNKILLFTFNLNRQKISTKLQKTKTIMLKTYIMIENFHMLSIVNQINQFFDENMKTMKIDTNIELLAMQIKFDLIIKNQFKLIKNQNETKLKIAKIEQDFKKSHMINTIKPSQIKPPNREIFRLIKIIKNSRAVKLSIVFEIFITTAKNTATNLKS